MADFVGGVTHQQPSVAGEDLYQAADVAVERVADAWRSRDKAGLQQYVLSGGFTEEQQRKLLRIEDKKKGGGGGVG